MDVVRHAIDCKEFLLSFSYDASYVFEQVFLPLSWDETIPALNSKHDLNVDLCVCVCQATFTVRVTPNGAR